VDFQGELLYAGLSPRTVAAYVAVVMAAEQWFVARLWILAEATSAQVSAYSATKPRTFASQNLLRAALVRYWRMAGHPRPPVGALRVPPKPAMTCRALDEDDARILAKTARARGDPRGLAVLLGMYQALRREEIATLPTAAFDGDWMTVVGKGSKSRTIPLHAVVGTALDALPLAGEYVFPGRFGGPVSPATIWEWIREVADEAGVGPVRPHWLRHTCLATQNDATGDLRAVQAFAGHSRPETTAGYTRATRRRLIAVSRALDY
jgi:integrase